MNADPKLVVGYLRCSSVVQVNDGETLDRQRISIHGYCQLRNLDQARFIQDEAVSGFKENRPGIAEIIALVKSGKVSAVIVADLSRLSRSVKHTLELIDLFTKHGVTFVSLNEDIRTDTAMGKFFLSLCAAFNQMYRDSISEKAKACWRHKRSKNEKGPGSVPYGYSVVGKHLVPDDLEQGVIQEIVRLASNGKTTCEIATSLTGAGIQTKTGKAVWNPRIVANILRRERTKANSPKAS